MSASMVHGSQMWTAYANWTIDRAVTASPYTGYLIVYSSTLFKLYRQRVASDSEVFVGYEFDE